MDISNVITVNITRETARQSQANFGILLVVGPNVNVNNRIEFFEDADSAIAKITGSDTLEESMITDFFAQNPKPAEIALGSLSASHTAIFSGTYSAGAIAVTVNGVAVTQDFSTDLDTTIPLLATKIAALDDVASANYTANMNTLVITPDTGKTLGVSFDLTDVTGTLEIAETKTELSETYAEALAAIKLMDNSWYAVAIATRTVAKQESAADWVSTQEKILGLGSADTNIIDETLAQDTTSIAAYAKSNALDRVFVQYCGDGATEGAEAATFGKILPQDPGSYTAKFLSLVGVAVDNLTPTQSTNARNKNANTYELCGGKNITSEGTVGSGEFIDIIIGADWLVSQIRSEVFSLLTRLPKLPFTSSGIAAVQSAIDKALRLGQSRGFISPEEYDEDKTQIGGYAIVMPKLEDVSTADKSTRSLTGVKFTAWIAGAIHKITINGTVTL